MSYPILYSLHQHQYNNLLLGGEGVQHTTIVVYNIITDQLLLKQTLDIIASTSNYRIVANQSHLYNNIVKLNIE